MVDKNNINALPEKLYGQDLLARVKALQEKKKKPTVKEMARSCGYLHRETGGEQITEFQRELLIASGVFEHPSSKPPEIPEPLKVGALYKIYSAKAFLSQLGLKEGDQIEWRIRKTRNGPIAELTPLSRAQDRQVGAEPEVEADRSSEGSANGEPIDRQNGLIPLTPVAPGNNKERTAG